MFIDEVNSELIQSVAKAQGDVVIVLLRQERLKSFVKLWHDQNMDYYSSQ